MMNGREAAGLGWGQRSHSPCDMIYGSAASRTMTGGMGQRMRGGGKQCGWRVDTACDDLLDTGVQTDQWLLADRQGGGGVKLGHRTHQPHLHPYPHPTHLHSAVL